MGGMRNECLKFYERAGDMLIAGVSLLAKWAGRVRRTRTLKRASGAV
jgi:hypothetical protein